MSYAWHIEIVRPGFKSMFTAAMDYSNLETRLSELESEGWTIYSISAEPGSASVMVTCRRSK